MTRSPHPDDCRDALRALAQRRAAMQDGLRAWPRDLAHVAHGARSAGLSLSEIARLAGVARTTVYSALEHEAGDG